MDNQRNSLKINSIHKDEYPSGNVQLDPEVSLLEGRNIGQDFTIKGGQRMYHVETIPGFPYYRHRGSKSKGSFVVNKILK